MEENKSIWDSLSETDPAYTKSFKGVGGYSGIAINPTYGRKKLTELFGTAGIGWGTEIVESRFDEGRWLNEKDKETIHTLIIKLWYKTDEKTHHVFGVGTTVFIGENKNGIKTDSEFYKKTMTDAFTNAAKELGLSADVFMGKWDDNKYVNDIKAKYDKIKQMPKRSEINKTLSTYKTVEAFEAGKKWFIENYGEDSFSMRSNNTGSNKNETWGDLFEEHGKRVNGENPFDANEDPIQKSLKVFADFSNGFDTKLEWVEALVELDRSKEKNEYPYCEDDFYNVVKETCQNAIASFEELE